MGYWSEGVYYFAPEPSTSPAVGGGGNVGWYISYPSNVCPEAPPEDVAAHAFAVAPSALLEQYRAALWAANRNTGPTLQELRAGAHMRQVLSATYGGDDCQATSDAGRAAYYAFQSILSMAAGGGGGGAQSAPGNTVPPGGGSSPYTEPATDWGRYLLPAGVAVLGYLALRR